MSLSNREILYRCLLQTKDKPYSNTSGICYSMRRYAHMGYLSETVNELNIMMRDYFKSVGLDPTYPVGHMGLTGGGELYDAEVEDGTLWQNPHRLQLLADMIEYFKPVGE